MKFSKEERQLILNALLKREQARNFNSFTEAMGNTIEKV